jgi:hypothetical protein
MGVWILLALALWILWCMTQREHYVEVVGPGVRPTLTGPEGAAWRSKIEAQIPIGGSTEDYLAALQKFYDDVYVRIRPPGSTTSPRDTDVEAFLTTNTFPNLSTDALRQIILSGFSVDRSGSAAAREAKQTKFTPTEALQPRDGVDQVYGHMRQELYIPADKRPGPVPEGVYESTEQTEPTNEGVWDDKTAGWSPVSFASVCTNGKCTQNVL